MQKFKIFSLALLFALFVNLYFSSAQSIVGEWRNYTSTLDMQDVVEYEGQLYIATSGGLLTFAQDTKLFNSYGNRAGLSALDINTIKFDDNQILWLGMASGELNFYDVTQQHTLDNYIVNYDAASFRENLSNIVAINGDQQNCFVACQKQMQWGIIHFTREDGSYFYKDYYFQYPENLSQINDLIISDDVVYLATPEGLLAGDFMNSNLKSPDSWNFVSASKGQTITSLVQLNNDIYFSGDKKLYKISASQPQLINNDSNGEINKISVTEGDQLHLLTNQGIYQYNVDTEQLTQINAEFANALAASQSGNLYGITEGQGLWEDSGPQIEYYLPNTLLSNKYTSIYVAENNQIAAASSQGISISTDQGWYNIVRTNDYENPFKGNTINEVDPDYFSAGSLAYNLTRRDGKIWSLEKYDNDYFATLHRSVIKGQQKGGLLRFNPIQPSDYEVYDTTNNVLTASDGVGEGSPHYLVPAAMEKDPEGNLWIINQYAQNGNVLAVLMNNGEWQHFSLDDYSRLNHFLNDFAFGPNNRVWIASRTWPKNPQSDGGIFMLDYKGTLKDKSDDIWRRFSTSDGLEDNKIFSLDFDKSGTLWIMSLGGIQKASVDDGDLDFIRFRNGKYRLFTNLSFANFCHIKCDQDNNVWFSTDNDGIKIYSKTGEWWPLGQLNDSLDISEGLNAQNSGLLSNTVLDFDFHEESGKVYLATDRGISAMKFRYPIMQQEYDKLEAFPSPFKIPQHNKLVVDGLLANSTVKIMTLTGELVAKISHNSTMIKGRQLHWNGKNEDGNFVGSGVYIIMAYNDEGKSKAGKIAVVRQ